jgi:hypothetical protein
LDGLAGIGQLFLDKHHHGRKSVLQPRADDFRVDRLQCDERACREGDEQQRREGTVFEGGECNEGQTEKQDKGSDDSEKNMYGGMPFQGASAQGTDFFQDFQKNCLDIRRHTLNLCRLARGKAREIGFHQVFISNGGKDQRLLRSQWRIAKRTTPAPTICHSGIEPRRTLICQKKSPRKLDVWDASKPYSTIVAHQTGDRPSKFVIPADAGIHENTLDAGSSPA